MNKNPQYSLKSKAIKILLLIISVLIISETYSQSITWQRLYNGPNNTQDICKDLCPATNGNFFAIGSSKKPTIQGYFIYALKLNQFGDTIWTRIIDSVSSDAMTCAPSGDGGVVIAGEGHFTLKLDSSGNIGWKRNYGGGAIKCYDIINTTDGGFLACGEILNFTDNLFHYDGYVMKLDFNGNLIWDTIYPTTDLKILNSVVEAFDGFVFAGLSSNFIGDTAKCLILKIDNSGSVIWEKKYKVLNNAASGLVINKINSGFLIGGNTADSTLSQGNVYFMRIDDFGNQFYVKRIPSNVTEGLYDIKPMSNNKYALTTYRDIAKNLIVDTLGTILYEKLYFTQYYSIFQSIMPLNNGDILFGGTGRFFGFEEDVYIVRTDSMLNSTPIGINTYNNQLPQEYLLYQNYPNPFNPATTIKYEIPKDAEVTVKVYDLLGREVFSINEYKKAGSYEVKFDGSNLASGMYFYAFEVNGYKDTKKMVLLK